MNGANPVQTGIHVIHRRHPRLETVQARPCCIILVSNASYRAYRKLLQVDFAQGREILEPFNGIHKLWDLRLIYHHFEDIPLTNYTRPLFGNGLGLLPLGWCS